ALLDAGDPADRLRADGAGEGACPAHRRRQARPAQRADPGDHAGRALVRRAAQRRRDHRNRLQLSRHRTVGGERQPAARHPGGDGLRPDLLRPPRAGQPLRGRPVRARGPADPPAVTAVRSSTPAIPLSRAPRAGRTVETGWHRTLRRFRRNPLSVLGAVIIAFFVVLALLAPFLAHPTERNPFMIPHSGYASDPHPPGPGHPFGTTEEQFDLYYGVIWGSRTAFVVALSVVAAAVVIALLLGSISGYYGGPLDELVMRVMDIFLAFLHLILASLNMGGIVITFAALSFLGLGAPIGYADWGQLISLSHNWIVGTAGDPFTFWYTLIVPGTAIFLFVLGWNLLGDAFRDVFDP